MQSGHRLESNEVVAMSHLDGRQAALGDYSLQASGPATVDESERLLARARTLDVMFQHEDLTGFPYHRWEPVVGENVRVGNRTFAQGITHRACACGETVGKP